MTTDIPPPKRTRRFPTLLQAVLITASGFALAFFGCLGALSGLTGTGEIRNPAFVVLFIVGLLGFVFGLGLFLYFILIKVIAVVDARHASGPGGPAAPPPGR